MRARQATLLWACSASLSRFADAAIVEASTLATVTAVADLYDSSLSAENGCDPSGCVAELTRDGDATSLESRWSCQPALGDAGSVCRITYGLGIQYQLTGLNIAMFKGDERTRTLEINIDNLPYTVWTSSGTTTGFETIDVDTMGRWIEIVGVLEDSEWLSIMEVEILVDDGVTDTDDVVDTTDVEAGSLGTVTATSALFDPSLGDSNGCEPAGCTAELTRDGDVSDGSRWSCVPSLGGTCSISYDLGAVYDLSELRLALYNGAIRVRTIDVSVDGSLATTWTSSGTTDGFESIDLSGYSGQDITVTGVLDNSEWLSIKETEIMVLSDGVVSPPSPSTPTPAPVFAPVATPTPTVATPEQLFSAKEIGTQDTTVTTTAGLFDPDLAVDNGCDPAGCTGALTRDGDMTDTSRWACAPSLGGACSISYDLGREFGLDELRVALYNGDIRVRTIDVIVDGALLTTWTSSGTTNGFESIALPDTASGTLIELQGVLDDSEWLSIIETEIMVWPQNVVTPPPASAATVPPATAPVQPVTPPSPTPAGDLQPVGLTPLAIGDESPIDRYATKDGDFTTSWTCTGDPTEPNDEGITYYQCELLFGLVYYRHVKQVKIALADGAERSVDMRLGGRFSSSIAEEFVTSSGTTDGFETYDFDYKASSIRIAAVFSSPGESISISEVEIVEEVMEGEALIDGFSTPYDNGDGLWNEPTTDGFEWSSDSNEAIDRSLTLFLAGYYTVTELQLMFPEGDTYQFDLTLFNKLDGTGEAYTTITGLESTDTAGFQSFDLTGFADQYVTSIGIEMKGTGSGAPGFAMLDALVLGTKIDNPSDTFHVGSTFIEYWGGDGYPDFVGSGSGDQNAINGAICAVKKGTYDGVSCVDMDDTATGTVDLSWGAYYVDGNIFMQSGVLLLGAFGDDDPNTTDIVLEEGAEGNTDIDAIVVMDGIQDAWIEDVWIQGNYDPETDGIPAVSGLGSACLSVANSQNITCEGVDIRYCSGDALVVRDSTLVNIDAGRYDEEYLPWTIGLSGGTGLIVDTSDSVWVRRTTFYENAVAGLHIMGSNNFTFEATIDSEEGSEGEGNVGSVDGQQPIEVIVEASSLVKFQDMRVQSVNDPVMTITGSTTVSFTNGGYSNVPSGTCTIQTDDPSTVTIDADEEELVLEGTCYVKV
ncbi:unnamed protein product [Ectocarpus sp. 4 AP-2014]